MEPASNPRHLAGRFVPEHCPHEACEAHIPRPGLTFGYVKFGFYKPKCSPEKIQRYLCKHCGRTFSTQSFSTTYYLKRPELQLPIAHQSVGGGCHRQIARHICAASTVTRQLARLGRHSLLLDAICALEVRLAESVVYDDFETFGWSQYFPLAIGTAVGHDTAFVYRLSYSVHRRGGHLSPEQKRVQAALREKFGELPPYTRMKAFRAMLDALLASSRGGSIRLITDGHPAYHRVLARHPERERVRHDAYPNPARGPKGSPRSPEARERDRAMFQNDQLHRFVRHSKAPHRRETIAFGRSWNALVERAALFQVWRNLCQAYAERKSKGPSPAMLAGVTTKKWTWDDVLARRLFPKHHPLAADLAAIYDRRVQTPPAPPHRPHALVNAR